MKNTNTLLGVLILLLLPLNSCKEMRTEHLKDKTILVIGDSYVKNHMNPIEDTWHYQFAKKYGMQYLNYGINGNSIAFDSDRFGEAMHKRIAHLPASVDYVLVIGGHNDSNIIEAQGGTIEQFEQGMHHLCQNLMAKYPKASILFITRWNSANFKGSSAEQVVDKEIAVCKKYNLPILDVARNGNIDASNRVFKAEYFIDPYDQAHLNAKGHDKFLRYIERELLECWQ